MTHRAHRTVAALPALLIAGCMVGPDYEAPPVELSEEYRSGIEQTVATRVTAERPALSGDSLAIRGWQEVFTDPVLSSLIDAALRDNLELAAVRARLDQAQALMLQSRARLFPQFSIPFVYDERSEDARGRTDVRYELFGVLAWELDFFGYNRRRVEVAEANVLAAEHRLYLQQVSLIGRIATAYFELLDIAARQSITNQTVETRRRALEILRLRKESGVISGLAVRQAEVALAEAEAALPAFLQRRQELENAIKILCGEAPNKLEELTELTGDVSMFIDMPGPLPTGLPSDLLRRRPDIIVAEANLRAATAQVGVAEADFFPRLTLTGDRGTQSDSLDELLGSGLDTWRVTTTLSQPVFQGGRLRGSRRQALALRDEALAVYQQAIFVALGEVSAALQGHAQAETLVAANSRRTESARSYLDLAMLKYEEGVLGYLDVLDAQRQLFEAELSLSAARRQQLVSLAALYRALGGGWDADVT